MRDLPPLRRDSPQRGVSRQPSVWQRTIWQRTIWQGSI
jgi:hypothetical protein